MAEVDGVTDEVEEAGAERTAETAAFWSEVRVDPVEIALPGNQVGFTLRAYRLSDEIKLSEVEREEDDYTVLDRSAADDEDDIIDAIEDDLDEDDDEDDELDEDELDEKLEDIAAGRLKADERRDSDAEDAEDADAEAAADADEDVEDDEDKAEGEEVPVFLGYAGKLYLFRTPEALVEFVRSDTPHDLAQLDTWSEVRERISVADVVPDEADRYELDLVVRNLRGTQDVWDAELLIRAGEVARDLAYALRIRPVLSALAPGSPLDDLDEALRATTAGGFGGFMAKRRLKKIGAQQAALGWRTIIGKISATVDWRE